MQRPKLSYFIVDKLWGDYRLRTRQQVLLDHYLPQVIAGTVTAMGWEGDLFVVHVR